MAQSRTDHLEDQRTAVHEPWWHFISWLAWRERDKRVPCMALDPHQTHFYPSHNNLSSSSCPTLAPTVSCVQLCLSQQRGDDYQLQQHPVRCFCNRWPWTVSASILGLLITSIPLDEKETDQYSRFPSKIFMGLSWLENRPSIPFVGILMCLPSFTMMVGCGPICVGPCRSSS